MRITLIAFLENGLTASCRDELRGISRGKARPYSRRSRKIKNAGRVFYPEFGYAGIRGTARQPEG
jgi:hypothetical protein